MEGHFPRFSAIQAHPSCRFHLAIDFPGLRRGGSSPQSIDHPQDFLKQIAGHGGFRHLERGIATMADHLRADLDQLYTKRNQLRLGVNK